jgi:hypothetical protein
VDATLAFPILVGLIAVSIATLSPIDCISGSAFCTRLAHSTISWPISRIGGSN